MYEVTVFPRVGRKIRNAKDAQVVTYTGVVAIQAGNSAMDIAFYNNQSMIIPFEACERILRKQLTEEEAMASTNKGFVEWYVAAKEKAEARAKAEAEADAAGELTEHDSSVDGE